MFFETVLLLARRMTLNLWPSSCLIFLNAMLLCMSHYTQMEVSLKFHFMCMSILPIFLCTTSVPSSHRGQKKALHHQEL